MPVESFILVSASPSLRGRHVVSMLIILDGKRSGIVRPPKWAAGGEPRSTCWLLAKGLVAKVLVARQRSNPLAPLAAFAAHQRKKRRLAGALSGTV
jgi:hypothetical protein